MLGVKTKLVLFPTRDPSDESLALRFGVTVQVRFCTVIWGSILGLRKIHITVSTDTVIWILDIKF